MKEMEMVVPIPIVEYLDSNCSSPYMTAPSSPQQRFNTFFSSAPSRASSTFHHETLSTGATVPFDWEERPGTPKRISNTFNQEDYEEEEEEDFAFDFSGHLDRASLSAADELFDRGKIRPLKLKPPPGNIESNVTSPRSPRFRKSSFMEALSPKNKKDFDPFEAALEESRKRVDPHQLKDHGQQRRQGRERRSSSSYSSHAHKASRSLSPMRVSDIVLENEDNSGKSSKPSSVFSSIFSSASSFSKGYKRWRLKDLLLFRSASEGRASGSEAIGKYAALSKKRLSTEDGKESSFRSTEGGSSRRRVEVSAHELHYTANRAITEEMKKKTFLPYKQGLLGCLGFSPGLHEISRGIGSLTRG